MSTYSDLPGGLAIALEAAINRGLALDPESRQRLGRLSGKIIAIELETLDRRLVMLIDAHRVRLLTPFEGTADATICASPAALVKMHMSKGAAVAGSGIRFSGDPELGRAFQQFLDGFDIDWEGELAKLTGDVVAHQVGRSARRVFGWLKQSAMSLEQTAVDYVRHEARAVVGRNEVERFLDEVDTLRDDVARLEQRMRRLQKKTGVESIDHPSA